ncbi:hypothetical protein BD770DRAFT_447436 [Pilaira anomala]|nr:hypothetical protein BD770DRAFT_447436 [Pilaira anomala]
MKFESSDVTNVATAMDVDEELDEELKLPDSSDDEEENEAESKKERAKEKEARLKAFAEGNLGKLEVPEKQNLKEYPVASIVVAVCINSTIQDDNKSKFGISTRLLISRNTKISSWVLQQVCNQANSQFSKANKRLLEDIEGPESRKRTAKCLDDGILYASSSSSTSNHDFLPAPEHKYLNWAFIDSVRKPLKDKMDWEFFYQIGKDIGLFSDYNSSKRTKFAYFRTKTSED